MIIPYKVKNPPASFPVATVALIALNVLIFGITSDSFVAIRREIVDAYALRWGASPAYTVFTSMFLHGDIFHLAGNMLFLWVFGPAVEDRLGKAYIGLYFLAGFAGAVAQAIIGATGAIGSSTPMIGASGCIMGVLGAYWYMYAWSPVCMFYWVGLVWRGTFEVAAVWVIGAYFFLDLFGGFMARSASAAGGTANFAHVGGALVGALLVFALGIKRDSFDVAKVKAAQADAGDMNLLTCEEIWTLIQDSPENEELLVQLIQNAFRDCRPEYIKLAISADTDLVVARCPDAAVYYLLSTEASPDVFTGDAIVYLGKWCETGNMYPKALRIYELVERHYPNTPEAEAAMYRAAAIMWRQRHEWQGALEKVEQLLSTFPGGKFTLEAEDLRDEIRRQNRDAGSQAA